jgi:hypothetical protein
MIPAPSKCSTGLFAKYCGTTYNCWLLKPNPFRIIATVAVPMLTCWRLPLSWASSHAARPISWQTPATIPRWSRRSLIKMSVVVIGSPPVSVDSTLPIFAKPVNQSAECGLQEHKEAVRAYRQLAAALQEQELDEDASRFAYREQIVQRETYWIQRSFGIWFFPRRLEC